MCGGRSCGDALGPLGRDVILLLATRMVVPPGVRVGDKVYRVWGGSAQPWGRSWTRVNPSSVPDFRSVAGLPDVNTGRFVSEGSLMSTEGVEARSALPLDGNTGGTDELVIPNPQGQVQLEAVSGANPEF